MSSSNILSPVTTPGGLYPLIGPKIREVKEVKPLVINDDWQKDIQKAYRLLIKSETPAKLKLREYVQTQIERLKKKTDEQDKEFGALIIRNEEGEVELDTAEVGEDRSINFSPENSDGEVLGTIHFHPVTDEFSKHDIASFLDSKWEKVSLVLGKEGTLHLMVKDDLTKGLDEETEKWEMSHEKDSTESLAGKYSFTYYKGKDLDSLKLINGSPDSKVGSFEGLTSDIKGFTGQSKIVKKKKVN